MYSSFVATLGWNETLTECENGSNRSSLVQLLRFKGKSGASAALYPLWSRFAKLE